MHHDKTYKKLIFISSKFDQPKRCVSRTDFLCSSNYKQYLSGKAAADICIFVRIVIIPLSASSSTSTQSRGQRTESASIFTPVHST